MIVFITRITPSVTIGVWTIARIRWSVFGAIKGSAGTIVAGVVVTVGA